MKMMRTSAMSMALVLLVMMISLPAMAQAKASLKIANMSAVTYKSVDNVYPTNLAASGVKQKAMAPTGMVFLVLDMDLHATWDDATKQVRADYRKIMVVDESGTNYTPVARIYTNSYLPGGTGVNMYRADYKYKQDPNYVATFNYQPVYLVPAATKKVTFKLDTLAETSVEISEAREGLSLFKVPGIKVLGAKKVSEVKGTLSSFQGKLEVVGSAVAGQLIEVNVQFQPKGPNTGTGFYASSKWMGLTYELGGKTVYVPCAGGTSFNRFNPNMSVNISPKDGAYASKAAEFTFVVPEGATNLNFYYLLEKVGSVTLN